MEEKKCWLDYCNSNIHTFSPCPLALRHSSRTVDGTRVKKQKTMEPFSKSALQADFNHIGEGAVLAGWRPDRKVEEAFWNRKWGFKSELGRSAGRLPGCVPRRRSETVTGRGCVISPPSLSRQSHDCEEQNSEEGHSACWHTPSWDPLTYCYLPLAALCVCWLNPRLNRRTPLYNLGRRQERLNERKVWWPPWKRGQKGSP